MRAVAVVGVPGVSVKLTRIADSPTKLRWWIHGVDTSRFVYNDCKPIPYF